MMAEVVTEVGHDADLRTGEAVDVLELVDEHVGEWRAPIPVRDGAGTPADHVLEIGLAVRGELLLVGREHPGEDPQKELRPGACAPGAR